MRVITLNANGLRAAARKGFFQWLPRQKADVVCLQETRAHPDQRTEEMRPPKGWHAYYLDAEKKGYSGVALYSRNEPDAVHTGLGWPTADQEGRFICADYGKLSVASIYLPSGSSGDERQQVKFDFLRRLQPILAGMRDDGRSYILTGDWNIAHKEIDLKNWRGNKKNSGFLPEERQWMDRLFDEIGMVDAFRRVDPRPDQYTWWSNRGQAWDKNVGWRIDYQITTPDIADKVKAATIYKSKRFSDHAPLIMDYDL